MLKAALEPESISSAIATSTCGAPWPPHSGAAPRAFHPASYSLSQASLKPDGVRTRPSSMRQPSRSPTALRGPYTSRAKRATSVSTIFTSSGPQFS
jgi:hypothetical protein